MTKLGSKAFLRRAGHLLATASVAVAALAFANAASAQTLTIESWRNDDADVWNTKIIPAFNKKHPDIKVQFKADPPTEYNAALNARLAGGTAGDIITCRPFDASLDLFKKGNLTSVNDVKGIENFSDVAKSAWSTDDGKTTFCMPMASVIHGFVYNKEIFDELKLTPPKTVAEFHAVLDKIKADGKYTPLAMGTADQWEAATMGFQNIGVNYWKGEEGRKALIDGKQKFTDPAYVDVFKELATWAPYMGDGYKAQKYPDTQNLFTLGPRGDLSGRLLGRADLPQAGGFRVRRLRAARREGRRQVLHQRPHGYRASASMPSRRTRKPPRPSCPGWLRPNSPRSTPTSCRASSRSRMRRSRSRIRWRRSSSAGAAPAKARSATPIRSCPAARPNLENELWNVSAQVLNGTMKPEEAAKKVEDGLASWYEPHKK